MRKFPVAFIAGIVMAATASPIMVSAEPLREELNSLLAEHPDIRRARNDAAAAEARIGEARSTYGPRFELSGDTGWERTDSPDRRAAGTGPFEMRRDKITLTVTQNLFNGFRDQAGVNAAEIGHAEQQMGLENTRQELLFQGISQYLEVLRNVRLIKVAQTTENTIRTQLRLEDERVQRGSGIAVDVLQAKSRLQVAKEQRVAFEGRLQEALSLYKQLFGHFPDIQTLEEARPPKELLPASVEASIRTAVQYHPAFRQTQYQAEIAHEQKRIAWADYLPTVDLVGSVDYEDNVSTTRGHQNDRSLLVRARWEFFSAFRTRSRVESAARTLASRKDTLNFAVRRVEEDVRVAWERLKTERRRVDLLENAVNLSIEVFDAKKRLREAGKETALNVLDAEREVSDARIKLITADFDARIAGYLLTRRTGMLTAKALKLSGPGAEPVANMPAVPVAYKPRNIVSPQATLPAAPATQKVAATTRDRQTASVSPAPLKGDVQTPPAAAPRETKVARSTPQGTGVPLGPRNENATSSVVIPRAPGLPASPVAAMPPPSTSTSVPAEDSSARVENSPPRVRGALESVTLREPKFGAKPDKKKDAN